MNDKRNEIIALINDYIYTNGEQRITAEQLHEILNEIAVYYALKSESGGGKTGIDEVLAFDPNVSLGRAIYNPVGGRVELAGNLDMDGRTLPYVGLTSVSPTKDYTGIVLSNDKMTSTGNFKGIDPFTSGQKPEKEGDYMAVVVSNSENVMDESGEVALERGNILMARDINSSSFIRQNESNIELVVDSAGKKSRGERIAQTIRTSTGAVNEFRIDSKYLENKSLDSLGNGMIQRVSFGAVSWDLWKAYEGGNMGTMENLVSINSSGLNLFPGKKIIVYQGVDGNTAGTVQLQGGVAEVLTKAVVSNSCIMLTVQGEGRYDGRIRVEGKEPEKGFKITSSNIEDNCTVFWQIIDITK